MKKDVGKSTFNFNKQLVLGEIGALIFAPLVAFIASKFFVNESTISKFAVVGSILGAAIFWISTRVRDNSKVSKYTKKDLLRDISYFTPVAFLLTLILYYPSLYYISNRLLLQDNFVISSVVFAQVIAFSLFVLGINMYRYILIKFFNKRL